MQPASQSSRSAFCSSAATAWGSRFRTALLIARRALATGQGSDHHGRVTRPLAVHDVVALLIAVDTHDLVRGQLGTVVERLADDYSKSSSAMTRAEPSLSSRYAETPCWYFTIVPRKPFR
jgi:hypothetical protein